MGEALTKGESKKQKNRLGAQKAAVEITLSLGKE